MKVGSVIVAKGKLWRISKVNLYTYVVKRGSKTMVVYLTDIKKATWLETVAFHICNTLWPYQA